MQLYRTADRRLTLRMEQGINSGESERRRFFHAFRALEISPTSICMTVPGSKAQYWTLTFRSLLLLLFVGIVVRWWLVSVDVVSVTTTSLLFVGMIVDGGTRSSLPPKLMLLSSSSMANSMNSSSCSTSSSSSSLSSSSKFSKVNSEIGFAFFFFLWNDVGFWSSDRSKRGRTVFLDP